MSRGSSQDCSGKKLCKEGRAFFNEHFKDLTLRIMNAQMTTGQRLKIAAAKMFGQDPVNTILKKTAKEFGYSYELKHKNVQEALHDLLEVLPKQLEKKGYSEYKGAAITAIRQIIEEAKFKNLARVDYNDMMDMNDHYYDFDAVHGQHSAYGYDYIPHQYHSNLPQYGQYVGVQQPMFNPLDVLVVLLPVIGFCFLLFLCLCFFSGLFAMITLKPFATRLSVKYQSDEAEDNV